MAFKLNREEVQERIALERQITDERIALERRIKNRATPVDSGYPHGLKDKTGHGDFDYPAGHPHWGYAGSKEAWLAAQKEAQRQLDINKTDAQKTEDQRAVVAKNQSAELEVPLLPLEKFCMAVKKVMEASGKDGHQMMAFNNAWTYAQVKFPDLYADAFGADPEPDSAKEVVKLANRIGALAGKKFEFGWNFVREELPQIFNRLTPASTRILNCANSTYSARVTQKASKIFNRLVAAESALTGQPSLQVLNLIKTRHPGIYGLAEGKIKPSDSLMNEPGIWALIFRNESL